jgi:hypothetical protein
MKYTSTTFALACALLAVPCARAGGIYDVAADFSPTDNPNGVWSYGWSAALGSAFVADTTTANVSGLDFWEGPVTAAYGLGFPLVDHNGTANPITLNGTALFEPGQLAMHPGPDGQYSVICFMAPTAGTYQVAGAFTGLDFVGPTTTDVHVLVDGMSVFDGLVDGYQTGPSFGATLTLRAGDTVDFAVGYGTNGNYLYDTTGLTATLSSVPEPSTMILALIGSLALAGAARRRPDSPPVGDEDLPAR